MAVTIHPPHGVTFEGPASEEDRGRIETALQHAVRRALAKSAARQLQDLTVRRSGEIGEWPDLAWVGPADRGYFEPSDDDRGELTETGLLENIPATAAQRTQHLIAAGQMGAVAEPFKVTQVGPAVGAQVVPWWEDRGEPTGIEQPEHPTPTTQAEGIRVGPSGLEATLIAVTPGNRNVYLSSPHHAVSSSFSTAYQFGLNLFKASSFAILQGPGQGNATQYLTLGTEPSVDSADLGNAAVHGWEGAQKETAEGDVIDVPSLLLPSDSYGIGSYTLRGLVTEDRRIVYPDAPPTRQSLDDVETAARQGVQIPAATDARELLFNDVDRLVEQYFAGDDTSLGKAADYLSRFDANVFALVPWDHKVKYLEVLLAAWTWQMRKQAVVAIFTSLRSDSEIDAVIDELKRAGRYDQFIKDVDYGLYDLLVTLGESFAQDRNAVVTFEGLIELLDSMGMVSEAPPGYLTQIVAEPGAKPVPPSEMLVEAHDAAMGLIRVGAELGATLQSIFDDPDTVMLGIDAMAELIVNIWLANAGYQAAAVQIARTLARVDNKTRAALRGADRLGVDEYVLGRIRWRLLWEVASLFAEADAVVEPGVALTLPKAGRTHARSGEAVDAEAQADSAARLAALLNDRSATFGSVEETAELLSHLPEGDVQRLGQLLEFHGPELHAALEDAAAKTEVLKTLADKSGGLSEESLALFQRLAGPDGLEVEASRRVVAALPAGEVARFAATLQRIPLHRLTPETRAPMLELLAASAPRMDTLTQVGAETFAAIYRRVGGKAEAVDTYLRAIHELQKRLTGPAKAADLRRLLDALERDEPGAWLTVDKERHPPPSSTTSLDGA
ncbi:hypothetical protein [Mycobacterium sp.]|uniref:hypothetical protein n=1 Tax=Mycobacterium sp. TaxID=1785 RepID=UPI003D0E6517